MANKLNFSRGLENNLPTPVDGTVRFCTDTGSLYIDNNEERIKINAGKADQLTEKRTISLTGAITGAVEFDGSTDVTMNTMSAMESTQLIKDSEIAYSKDLPVANVSKYATVTEIGGMTRKCENLIPFPYTEPSKTYVGVTYTVGEDGGVTLRGTPTDDSFFVLYDDAILASSNHTISLTGKLTNARMLVFLYDSNNTTLMSTSSNSVFIDTEKYSTAVREKILVNRTTTGVACSGTAYIMANKGDTALPYEPYFEGLRDAKVTAVESVGVNLIPFPYNYQSKTESGVTWIAQEDGGIAVSGTPTDYTIFELRDNLDISDVDSFMITMYGTHSNIVVDGHIDDKNGKILVSNIAADRCYKKSDYPTAAYLSIGIKRKANGAPCTGVAYVMLNRGDTALPYTPYVKRTFPIPEAVQALDGYGQGISKEYHNKIVLDPASGVKKFVKRTKRVVFDGTENFSRQGAKQFGIGISDAEKSAYTIENADCTHFDYKAMTYGEHITGFVTHNGLLLFRYVDLAADTLDAWKAYLAEQYAAGTPVTVEYVLAEPVETDVSAYFTDDNLIGVEGGGTITAVNEYKYDVPFTINYSYGKNYDIISSKKFIGDLDGMATRAISDSNGKIITNTYLPKENGITDLAINGKIITYTKGDGTKGTLTTQDTISTLASLGITASPTELNYCDGVTSNIQAQLNSKQNIIGGAASSVVSNNLTGNKVLISNGSGKIAASSVTNTELGYLSGLTGSIKNSLSNKVSYVGTTPASVEASAFYCKLCTVTVPKGHYDIYFEFDLVGRTVGRFQNIKCVATKSGALALNSVKIFVSGNNGNIYEVVGYKNVITSDSVGDTLELWCKVPSWDKLNVFRRKVGGMNEGSKDNIQDWIAWEYTKSTALPTESSTKVKVPASLETWQGNAKTATTATTATIARKVGTGSRPSSIAIAADTDTMRYDAISDANVGSLPSASNANGILTVNTHSGNYYHQLGFSSNGSIYRRAFIGTAIDTTTAWKKILDSSNYSSYALSLGGGTLTGDLVMSSNNEDRFIKFGDSTSAWRIGYLGTGTGNANYLAFQSSQTTDNTWADALKFECETLNAIFAKNVTASNFIGNLSGNASTATKATKLGDSTIGSTSQPIYLNAGTATKISAVGTAYGGTGATTVAGARTNLEVYSKTEVDNKLAEKSSTTHRHTVSYTPVGIVSTPKFIGSLVHSGTPQGTTGIYSITDVGSVPSLTATVSNRCLTLSWNAGSVPTRSSVKIPSLNHKHSVTTSGTISKLTFTGTAATLTTSTPI